MSYLTKKRCIKKMIDKIEIKTLIELSKIKAQYNIINIPELTYRVTCPTLNARLVNHKVRLTFKK